MMFNMKFYKNPYIQIILLILAFIILSILYTYLTKKEKIITIKEIKKTMFSRGRYSSSNNYMIIDENNKYYIYDYTYFLQLIGLQKKYIVDSFVLKKGDNLKIIYYGIFQNYILDFQKL